MSLAQSAARGRELARLLDPEAPVPGVTQGALRPEIAAIAVPSTTVDKHNMTGDDFALTAGWGHYGSGDAVMPGQGRIVEREYTADERSGTGGGDIRAGREDVGRLSERPRFLAQRPRRDLGLQARRLSGAQEMAVLPRTGCARAGAVAGGSAVLCGDSEKGWGNYAIGGQQVSSYNAVKIGFCPL